MDTYFAALFPLYLTQIRAETEEKALLYGKSNGILAGVPFFEGALHPNSTRYLTLSVEIFSTLHCTVHWKFAEGSKIDIEATDTKKVLVAEITGKCRNILLGERTALNILTRASGIATQVHIDHLHAQSPMETVGFGNA